MGGAWSEAIERTAIRQQSQMVQLNEKHVSARKFPIESASERMRSVK